METREEWLTRCAAAIVRDLFAPLGFDTNADTGEPLIENLKASVGYPPSRALNARGRAIGVCISPKASEGGITEIFVSPFVSDEVEVAGVLVHELMHAAKGNKHGHDSVFEAGCHAVGLEGPAIATVPGAALIDVLQAITDDLGPYPHARINLTGAVPKPDGIGFIPTTTRLLKCTCVNPDCPSHGSQFIYGVTGYNVRVTWKWAQQGTPFCGICGDRMAVHLPRVTGGKGGASGGKGKGAPAIADGPGDGDAEPLPDEVRVINPGDMAGDGADSQGNDSNPADGPSDGDGSDDADSEPSAAGKGKDKGGKGGAGGKSNAPTSDDTSNHAGGKGITNITGKGKSTRDAHAVNPACDKGLNGGRCESCETAMRNVGLAGPSF